MIVWANRLSLPLLDPPAPGSTRECFRAVRACALRRSTSRPSTGFRPCSASCVRPAGFPGALGVGAAAAPTRRAGLVEGARRGVRRPVGGREARAARTPAGISGRCGERDRIVRRPHPLLRRPRRAGAAAFLDASGDRTPAARSRRSRAASPPSGSRRSAAGSTAAGSTAYAVDVTSPDVAELGLTVTRVPRAGALRARRRARRAVSRRPPALRARPRRLGLPSAALDRGRRQPRPAPVPVTAVRPDRRSSPRSSTAPKGVPLDDPAETLPRGIAALSESRARAARRPGRAVRRARSSVRTVARSSRTHDHRPAIELPPPAPLRGDARRRARAAAVGPRPRRSGRSGSRELVDAARRLVRREDGLSRAARPVPSAGALYPLELYVVAVAVDGLERGVYHYNPFRHRLARLAAALVAGRPRRRSSTRPSSITRPPLIVVVTAVFWRSRFKYGLRGYRFALLEAGHVVQNAVLAATELELPALPLGGFYDRRLDAIVGADGLDEATRPRTRARWCAVSGVSHAPGRRLAAGAVLAAVALRHGAAPPALGAPGGRARIGVGALAGLVLYLVVARRRPSRPDRNDRAVRGRELCVARARGGRRGGALAACRARRAASLRGRARAGRELARVRPRAPCPARAAPRHRRGRSAASIWRREPSARASPPTGPTTCCSSALGRGPRPEPRHEREHAMIVAELDG